MIFVVNDIKRIIRMVHTKAHDYAKNGKKQELEKEINRDINVIHEKNVWLIIVIFIIITFIIIYI